jgi:hypothetical protein
MGLSSIVFIYFPFCWRRSKSGFRYRLTHSSLTILFVRKYAPLRVPQVMTAGEFKTHRFIFSEGLVFTALLEACLALATLAAIRNGETGTRQ